MKTPQVVPSLKPENLYSWWEQWVQFVRNSPRLVDKEGDETYYWGEHLFVGWETHNEMFRSPRAVGVTAPNFADIVEYQDVRDLRAWRETEPKPLFLHEGILSEHCYIVGPSGAGKTSLGIMPLLMQLIRGAATTGPEPALPYPVVILDLKGDAALFHTVREEARRRGQKFKFFTTEKDTPTFRFNPFRGFDRSSRTIAQLCQLIMDALSLNHGKGYGRSYYTERSRSLLSKTLKRPTPIGSFEELYVALKSTLAGMSDSKAKADSFELLSVIEILTEYRQLITRTDDDLSDPEGIIFLPDVIRERQVVYFWLPAAIESISVGEIAKLVLFNLRTAAQDWKRQNPKDPRRTILVIDELQRVAGENLRGILQDARSFGISAILANQSLSDLRSPTGFDLAPTIMTNTRVKFFFTSPSERECYVFVERGKGFTTPRPFPLKGNPWLRDLAPEEFAYHVRLSWPFQYDLYRERDSAAHPTWDEIPGGDWRDKYTPAPEPVEDEEDSDILPHSFELVFDEKRIKQIALIEALFTEDETRRAYQDSAIDSLFDEDEETVPADDDEDED